MPQAQVASAFGLPGVTRTMEQVENNDTIAITPVAASQVSVTGLIPFKQVDVVKGWRIYPSINATYAAGTSTLALSQYFPYNFIGPLKLAYQNQYAPIDVVSGVDAAIFQSYRPYHYGEMLNGRNLLDSSTAAMPYNSTPQTASSSSYTTGSTNFKWIIDCPAGLDFDRFWPLDAQGRILSSAPLKAFVSPQYMAGTARIVQPQITLNPLISATGPSDGVPITAGGTQTTPGSVSGVSGTLGFQRYGYYQPSGPADSPAIFNWQYTRQSRNFSISGRSDVLLTVPLNGQILSVFVRLYDPSSGSLGAPIPLANVTKCELLYGSGLYKFQDTPLWATARFARQHQFRSLEGVIIWDMALGNDGLITNENALNTLTTSGVSVHLVFSGAQSATAYAVIGVEALTYVEVA